MSKAKESGEEIVTAGLVVIGDELLSGRTKDRNIGYIADHCTAVGIQLKEVRIVADEERAIVTAINQMRTAYTYVFTTGGIGPTHDDITADAVAKAFGVPIDINPKAYELLKSYYDRHGREMTPGRLRMARTPLGAELIENKISVAPGFMIGNVITMAGIPNIMQVMLDAVTPRLKTGRKMLSEAIDLNTPEGVIAELFGEHQKEFPDVSMGSYPYRVDDRPCTQLVLRSTDPQRLTAATAGLKAKLKERGML
ncbi:MAG TPA: molybdopterin-binding protein [Hyphomicrobiaceae bacterium]|nr:molybdopterin-binding protein [Hyphomicrobiaceae bacterium]